MALRIATSEDGVLELRFQKLATQIHALKADLVAAKRIGGLHTVRFRLFDNDEGWNHLRGLLRQALSLPIKALHVEDAVVTMWGHQVDLDGRGDHVARALGRLARPPHLEELAIRSSALDGTAFERLEAFLAGLKRLDLRKNALPDVALRLLSTWSGCASLETFCFYDNTPTARGVHAFATAGHFPALARLDLGDCKLGGASIRRLTEGTLPALTELALAKNPCGDEGAEAFAVSAWSERLERLDLSTCRITDAGARLLANSPHLRTIGVLDLRGNEIGDRGRKLLHDRFGERVLVG